MLVVFVQLNMFQVKTECVLASNICTLFNDHSQIHECVIFDLSRNSQEKGIHIRHGNKSIEYTVACTSAAYFKRKNIYS